jgi:glycosyltransferase involved in cell wall biosynthesis
MNPKISIIIPAFNAEKCIERCVESLLKQTFKDIEVIIIDDGSTDGTAAICDRFQRFDSRVRVSHKANGGVSAARNHGIEKASSNHIMFVDADDYADALYCEEMYAKYTENSADLVICGYRNIYADNGKSVNVLPENIEPLSENTIQQMFRTSFINMPWAKLYKKEFIQQLFNTQRTMGEDFEFNIKYLEGIRKIDVVNRVLYNYDTSSNSGLTSNKSLILSAIAKDYILVDDFLKKKSVTYTSVDFLYNRLKSYLKISSKGQYRDFAKYAKEINNNTELYNLVKNHNGRTNVDRIVRYLVLEKHYRTLYLLLKRK